MKKIFSMLLAVAALFILTACSTSSPSNSASASQAQDNSFQKQDSETNSTEPATLIYGSGDYTRINPAMDEHGEINILLFNGLTAHNGNN